MNKVIPIKAADVFLDNTKISSYKECPRRYFLRHVLNWRGAGTAMPLSFGLSWHSAMDVIWAHAKTTPRNELPRLAMAKFLETWESEGLNPDPGLEDIERYGNRTPGVAHEMLYKYVEKRWTILQEANLVAGEQPFAVPMPGMEGVWYVGRLDKVIDTNGQRVALEHKTTSEYKKDGPFKAMYIEQWYVDSQVKGYQFGAGLYHEGLEQVWVDAALVHKTIHDAFKFIPVQHQFPLLQEWIEGTQRWIQDMLEDEVRYLEIGLTPQVFRKNEQSCIGKYGACGFLNICRTVSNPVKEFPDGPPEGYIVEEWSPFETLGLEKLL